MKQEELDKILGDHVKWLLGVKNGVRLSLEGADLERANLRRADLEGANLEGANLFWADLRRANLRRANLFGADLRRAWLEGADLLEADLEGANLEGANLFGADLFGANLEKATGIPIHAQARLTVCPEEGSFTGWKKIGTDNGDRIIKLQITENAKRSSATTRKCRCSEARVLEIQCIDGVKAPESEIDHYLHEHNTRYAVGKMVYPDSFDENRWNECSNGIHFFITRQEAVDY